MKCLITSLDKELLKILNSESFIGANSDYDNLSGEINIHFDITNLNVGDNIYFYDNYYKQIPVIVDRIAKDNNNGIILYVRPGYLCLIDPYMYNQFDEISTDFKDEVINKFKRNSNYLNKAYLEYKTKYGNDCSKISIYANEIHSLMKYSNRTIIDVTNVLWNICDILYDYDGRFFGEWHRPKEYEFDMI